MNSTPQPRLEGKSLTLVPQSISSVICTAILELDTFSCHGNNTSQRSNKGRTRRRYAHPVAAAADGDGDSDGDCRSAGTRGSMFREKLLRSVYCSYEVYKVTVVKISVGVR